MRYICTHTDFDASPFKDGTIISSNELKNKYDLKIIYANNELKPLQFNYAEGYMIYDIWKKDLDSEFIEINHYRRKFLEETYNEEQTVLPMPLKFNILDQYKGTHNVNDLNECFDIIRKYYPCINLNNILKGNLLFHCNMFKMRHEDFNNYCSFVFKVLDIFNEKHNFKCNEDVVSYVSYKFSNPKDIKYQSRIQGFLMERISTIFFLNYFNFKSLRLIPILLLNENSLINYNL